MNNLIAYSDVIHPLYFLTRFIEGLRSDIWAVVMVQRPNDLDAACALALLREEWQTQSDRNIIGHTTQLSEDVHHELLLHITVQCWKMLLTQLVTADYLIMVVSEQIKFLSFQL